MNHSQLLCALGVGFGLHCFLVGLKAYQRKRAVPHWVLSIEECLDVKPGPVLFALLIVWFISQ